VCQLEVQIYDFEKQVGISGGKCSGGHDEPCLPNLSRNRIDKKPLLKSVKNNADRSGATSEYK
jgi:hypothetical protein